MSTSSIALDLNGWEQTELATLHTSRPCTEQLPTDFLKPLLSTQTTPQHRPFFREWPQHRPQPCRLLTDPNRLIFFRKSARRLPRWRRSAPPHHLHNSLPQPAARPYLLGWGRGQNWRNDTHRKIWKEKTPSPLQPPTWVSHLGKQWNPQPGKNHKQKTRNRKRQMLSESHAEMCASRSNGPKIWLSMKSKSVDRNLAKMIK